MANYSYLNQKSKCIFYVNNLILYYMDLRTCEESEFVRDIGVLLQTSECVGTPECAILLHINGNFYASNSFLFFFVSYFITFRRLPFHLDGARIREMPLLPPSTSI